MPIYVVTGQVFFADGFTYTVEAESKEAAEVIAVKRAENAFMYSWAPDFQEAVVNNVETVTNSENK